MTGDSVVHNGSIFIVVSALLLILGVLVIIKAQLVVKKESVEKMCLKAQEVCKAINEGDKKALCFAQEQLSDNESPYHYLISLESDGKGWYVAHLTGEAGYISKRAPLMGVLKQSNS